VHSHDRAVRFPRRSGILVGDFGSMGRGPCSATNSARPSAGHRAGRA